MFNDIVGILLEIGKDLLFPVVCFAVAFIGTIFIKIVRNVNKEVFIK